MRILLVEDDELLGDGLCVGLKQAGYTVDWLTDGRQAVSALSSEKFDLVVLDIGLPGLTGLEVLQKMRQRGDKTPVLILTSRDSVDDRVAGLDSGADDYLIKPFDLDELCARLRALTRRHAGRTTPVIEIGEVQLDPSAHYLTYRGQEVNLSSSEFLLLQYLMENAGRVMSRARLEETLYGWQGDCESNSLEVFIHHLRKKLDSHLIKTVRGVGYMFEKARC